MIVDCVPPPRIVDDINLGSIALPRPPLKTTAADCAVQGGTYEIGEPEWTLKVWMPLAEKGDPEAQYHVAEVYERGTARGPDPERAAIWYERAALQHHRPAAANLARLYERGLGVPEDWIAALRWQQQAAMVSDVSDELAHTQAALERLEQRQRALQQELDRLEPQRPRDRGAARPAPVQTAMAVSGSAAETRLVDVAAEGASDDAKAAELVRELANLQRQTPVLRAKIRELVKQQVLRDSAASQIAAKLSPTDLRQRLGKYYALVIGNENYLEWSKLETPIRDAEALQTLLEQRYGFEKPVEIVADGDFASTLDKLDAVRRRINAQAERGESVNFLLFFAGHGASQYPLRGHWIPIDGPREFSSRWISDTQVAEQLRAMKARQILVIADSCYASTLASRGIVLPDARPTVDALIKEHPRMVMASGGDQPAYEPTGAEHSLFARALLDVLREHHGMLTGDAVFRALAPRVRRAAEKLGVQQEPRYLPILDSDHDSGDFVLVATD